MRDSDDFDQIDQFADLDLIIDAALATYANPTADDGLEERMLQGLRRRLVSQSAPLPMRWLAWSAALAAACILALVFFSNRPTVTPANNAHQSGKQEKAQPNNPSLATNPPPETGIHIAAQTGNRMVTRTRPPISTQTAKAQPLPKLDVFPSPAPLDEQVEALAFFVQVAPQSEVKALLEKSAQADTPIAFAELEIPPLEPLDEGGK